MRELAIRSLDVSEFCLARDIAIQNIDFHARYVVERLPTFFDIARELDPDAQFGNRQRLFAGAFIADKMIGTVAVERVSDTSFPERSTDEDERFWNRFTEHDTSVYDTLQSSLNKTLIGAPVGSLSIHSLCVSPSYRRCGIARSLVRHVITCLDANEQLSLYIEFARLKWLRRFGVSLGFTTVRQTFSISERMEYGCWGSVLMRYQVRNGR